MVSLFDDAQQMLRRMVEEKWLKASGIVGFWRANAMGDDIQLYGEDGAERARLYSLRQQIARSNDRRHHVALADFVAPKETGLTDYVGGFAVTAGLGEDAIAERFARANDDYSKIVNMEEIAEQSVDQMQAYLLLEEKTSEKLEEASGNLEKAEKEFAAKYSVTLIDTKNELSDKMTSAGFINRYCDRLYILFFKSNWEDGQLFNALNNHKINDAEQARNSLIHFSEEGLTALKSDSLKDFKGNSGLANGCRQALEFYLNMAKNNIPKLTDFYLKQENFDKIKKGLEAKGNNRTKQDVDEYNKAVKDMNASVGSFNQLNQDLNKSRQEASKNWEEAERTFRDDLMPHYK